jgi:hypothetical protein
VFPRMARTARAAKGDLEAAGTAILARGRGCSPRVARVVTKEERLRDLLILYAQPVERLVNHRCSSFLWRSSRLCACPEMTQAQCSGQQVDERSDGKGVSGCRVYQHQEQSSWGWSTLGMAMMGTGLPDMKTPPSGACLLAPFARYKVWPR